MNLYFCPSDRSLFLIDGLKLNDIFILQLPWPLRVFSVAVQFLASLHAFLAVLVSDLLPVVLSFGYIDSFENLVKTFNNYF